MMHVENTPAFNKSRSHLLMIYESYLNIIFMSHILWVIFYESYLNIIFYYLNQPWKYFFIHVWRWQNILSASTNAILKVDSVPVRKFKFRFSLSWARTEFGAVKTGVTFTHKSEIVHFWECLNGIDNIALPYENRLTFIGVAHSSRMYTRRFSVICSPPPRVTVRAWCSWAPSYTGMTSIPRWPPCATIPLV